MIHFCKVLDCEVILFLSKILLIKVLNFLSTIFDFPNTTLIAKQAKCYQTRLNLDYLYLNEYLEILKS